ncbi:MAG: hypothetical protein ACOYO1_02455 [Bacteroidales bacterium]
MNIPGQIDLIAELAKITEKKPESNISEAQVIGEQKNDKPKINPSDFDYDKINEIAQEPAIKAEQIQEKPATPPPTFEQYKDEARALVGFISGMSCLFLPTLYRRKLLSKDEYIKGKTLLKRIKRDKNAETEFSSDEWDIYEKLLMLDEYEDSLPLDEKETETIAQPLAECMQKWGKKTSPEMRLLFAFGTVFIPRSLVLFGRY